MKRRLHVSVTNLSIGAQIGNITFSSTVVLIVRREGDTKSIRENRPTVYDLRQ